MTEHAMSTIFLGKFEAASIRPSAVVVVIGKRSTGKTTLVRDLLFHHRDVPSATVVSPTEHFQRQFGDISPPLQVYDEYVPAILEAVVERQKVALETPEDARAFLVLDDCMYDSCWARDENLRQLVMSTRPLKVTSVVTMGYPLRLPSAMQVDYVFLLREGLVGNRQRMYESYGSDVFPTFDVFCQVMDRCTEDHECLVIDRTRLEPRAFWYKAGLHGPFSIGDGTVHRTIAPPTMQPSTRIDDVRRMSSEELTNLPTEPVAVDDSRRKRRRL